RPQRRSSSLRCERSTLTPTPTQRARNQRPPSTTPAPPTNLLLDNNRSVRDAVPVHHATAYPSVWRLLSLAASGPSSISEETNWHTASAHLFAGGVQGHYPPLHVGSDRRVHVEPERKPNGRAHRNRPGTGGTSPVPDDT